MNGAERGRQRPAALFSFLQRHAGNDLTETPIAQRAEGP